MRTVASIDCRRSRLAAMLLRVVCNSGGTLSGAVVVQGIGEGTYFCVPARSTSSWTAPSPSASANLGSAPTGQSCHV